MVLSDFLSRQNNDNSNPHEIIPISFNMHNVLQENYYKIDRYLVQTRSQTQFSGIKLPEAHGMRKNLDPNMKLERQHANPIKGSVVKLHMGQGRAGLKRKRSDPINHTINQPSELSQNSWQDQNRNRKNKPSTFQRYNVYYKQCRCRDDPYKAFNPRCSFPSRSNLHDPSQTS